MKEELANELIRLALREDVGEGDCTTLATIPREARGMVQLLVKDSGVLAGVEAARRVLQQFDDEISMTVLLPDGTDVRPGDIAFRAEGRVQSLLQTERLVLNLLQRMSGIATMTRRYVRLVEGTKVRILDTRKTTPGFRVFEKEAVAIGGATNHRFGLFDMILLKDNHVDFSGGIAPAIARAKEYRWKSGLPLQIEIEVRSLNELDEALRTGGVDRILLDNFSVTDTLLAVRRTEGRVPLESSGGITIEMLRSYALTGVDYISIGALTHSVSVLDMSLKAVRI
jgi:nicotinate-nucleotide pyrophosphorylase (carboxylating)